MRSVLFLGTCLAVYLLFLPAPRAFASSSSTVQATVQIKLPPKQAATIASLPDGSVTVGGLLLVQTGLFPAGFLTTAFQMLPVPAIRISRTRLSLANFAG